VTAIAESTEGDHRLGLIAQYGQLRDGELSDHEVGDHLVDLVVELLREGGIGVRRLEGAGTASDAAVAFTLDGIHYLFEVARSGEPTTLSMVEQVRRVAAARPGVRRGLLSLSGYAPSAVHVVGPGGNHGVILLDRSHLEAVLSGLIALSALLTEVGHRAVFDERPFSSLTTLLTEATEPPPPPRFVTFDRIPPSWNLVAEVAPGVQVQHLFSGDGDWAEPLGMAADVTRALVSLPDGIAEVDLKRGTTSWAVPLPGCHGRALLRPDGTVLTLCNDAVVEWKDGVLRPVAGGFGDARALFSGPGGAWVLSGSGPTFGRDAATLALTRLGHEVGQQHRHRIHFDADVRTAGWLSDLRFFLAAAGHSAVLDLASGPRVRPEDWIETPHRSPGQLVVLNPATVITASQDGGGVRTSLYRTDLLQRTSDLVTEVNSNRLHGLALSTAGHLLVLGDVRGDDVLAVQPVLLQVKLAARNRAVATAAPGNESKPFPLELPRLPPRGGTDPVAPAGTSLHSVGPDGDRYDAVRAAARGLRRDYALDPKPIDQGGQAVVTAATHKLTGVRVAFKKLLVDHDEARARMRREVEAGELFGGHPHVVPILDYSPLHNWFVMPLAEDTAQTEAAQLADPAALHGLVAAICDALREPHQLGWIHRDLKPDNILKLDKRWAVADWGLGRRPRGLTSYPGRTRAGELFGTDGFAAPELSVDAHEVGPQTDIYAIGQIIGWALCGRRPQANVPLLPPGGPWHNIVKATTLPNPTDRPTTVDVLLSLISDELTR
jgi:hypothetical protein